MKSYIQSYNKSNIIRAILYLPRLDFSLVIHYLIYLTFLINFPNQPMQSTFLINLQLNQRRHWIMIYHFLKHTYIKKYTLIH